MFQGEDSIQPEFLSTRDVLEIARVVLKRTNQCILRIEPAGESAVVSVGQQYNPLAGARYTYTLQRTAEGWRICGEGEWIS